MAQYQVKNDNTAIVLQLHARNTLDSYYKDLNLPIDRIQETAADSNDEIHPVTKVAIVGGGVSGLHAAMLLGTKYEVDVFEASDRVGGRLCTHKFSEDKWDYFDVGAMRFPDTQVMKETYKLFGDVGTKLLDYHKETGESFLYYNNIRCRRSKAEGEQFGASEDSKGNVPREWADIGYKKLMQTVYGRFVHGLKQDPHRGLEELMKWDDYSTRGFMAFVDLPEYTDPISNKSFPKKDKYPTSVIDWLETMWFSVGWFDRAFTEAILEIHAFAIESPKATWKCVEDGSQSITDAMKRKLETHDTYKANVTIKTSKQVTAVIYSDSSHELMVSGENRLETGQSDFEDKGYSHVILAVSPQVMRFMNLSTCQLDYTQRSALFMLQPGPSVKVGMKFKTNWWKDLGIHGGESNTDRPVRTVVYPSYGNDKSTVLIASYSWTQDAANIGSLIQGPGTFDEKRLKSIILDDLAVIHDLPRESLEKEYVTMYPFDWAHNPLTMGAFALFGPGQFKSFYGSMARSAANGRLHFAGEAISTCHAWVAGALESANRAVYQIDPDFAPDPQDPMGLPHGVPGADYPTLLSKDALMKQLAVSSYLQGLERNQQ